MQDERVHRMTDVYARLAPGATIGGAQAELRQIAARLHEAYPAAYPKAQGFDTVLTPWKDELTAKARPTLMILLVTTFFVLVIACANVANLTLTRSVHAGRCSGGSCSPRTWCCRCSAACWGSDWRCPPSAC
jgi:hypothetical protein